MGRVLLVKLGAIGDVVMLLPAAYGLHAQGHEVEWLCGAQVAPLLALYPWITPLVVDDSVLLRGGARARVRSTLEASRRLIGRRYDLVATIYYDPRYRLLTQTARAKRRLSLSMEDRGYRILPGRHYTDEYARVLLGLDDDVRPEARGPVAPPVLPASPLPRGAVPRVVLVPGGARNLVREEALRRWPIENFVAVAEALLKHGHEVVLSGGEGDRWASAAFAGLPVIDCIGRHSLAETVGLFDASDVVVTPDTGPLHLAGITRAAIVAIFGPTAPSSFLPQRPGVVALWGGEGFACRPCYDGRNYAPCHNNACVRQVTPAMVLAEVEEMLAACRQGVAKAPRTVVPPSTIANRTGEGAARSAHG